MDIDKAGRVRSYVQAQLAFVPFYGADLLVPGGSRSETFDFQTPLLTARNPLVSSQPESDLTSASLSIGVQGSKRSPKKSVSMLSRDLSGNHKKRMAKHSSAAKEQNKRLLTSKTSNRNMSDPDALIGRTKDLSSMRRERRRRHEKPRLPVGLSFLCGFAPKNVGPSRLTVG